VTDEELLAPEELARYADAIVKASLGFRRGETLVIQAEPVHRAAALATAAAAYRAGAHAVALQ